MGHTFEQFMQEYASGDNASRVEAMIEVEPGERLSPFIVIKSGDRTIVVNPMPFNDHLCVDVHSFVGGEDATAGVFAMSDGTHYTLENTPYTSHSWPSAHLIAILVGEQEDAK